MHGPVFSVKFLQALVIVTLSFTAVEISLRVADPWGMRYFDDAATAGRVMFIPDDQRGYILKDGLYTFSHWQATIQQGRRVVPDTTPSDCSLALLGDSVTFGGGVNDDATWANQLARMVSGVEVVNYGTPRYNAANSAATRISAPDHDVYLYTVFNNDSEPAYNPATDALIGGYQQAWVVLYTQFLLRRYAPPAPVDVEAVYTAVDDLLDAGRVYLVAFRDDVLTNALVSRGYDVYVVPYPPHPVSRADFHLNEQGNALLAESLLPLARQITSIHC